MSRQRASEERAGERRTVAAGRFSYEGLDRVLHEKARLGILASLAANSQGLLFNDLKQMCSLTDGNLSRHLAVLTEATLVEIGKDVKRGRLQTTYRLTGNGRRRFAEYINVLERVISDAQVERDSHTKRDAPGKNWSPA